MFHFNTIKNNSFLNNKITIFNLFDGYCNNVAFVLNLYRFTLPKGKNEETSYCV